MGNIVAGKQVRLHLGGMARQRYSLTKLSAKKVSLTCTVCDEKADFFVWQDTLRTGMGTFPTSPGFVRTSPGFVRTSPGVVLPTRRVVRRSQRVVKRTSRSARHGQRGGQVMLKKLPSVWAMRFTRAFYILFLFPQKIVHSFTGCVFPSGFQ